LRSQELPGQMVRLGSAGGQRAQRRAILLSLFGQTVSYRYKASRTGLLTWET
jgi:hypothetical protein